jgi:4-diphosphocytidyl-2-C-methyl-D-erythritol kinase
MMRGVGEILAEPMALPVLPAVLINPGVAVATRDVFAALAAPTLSGPPPREDFFTIETDAASLVALLQARRNDLEIPAVSLQPVIADVLESLRASAGCLLVRMSGSGATCFGLFGSVADAEGAAQALAAAHPSWWVRATVFR